MAIMTRPLGWTRAEVTVLGYGAMELRGRAAVEQSLRRLRTDHLDLVQVHMSPDRATLERNHTVETLQGCGTRARSGSSACQASSLTCPITWR